jgi:FAD/FMN-containing dehydrogenase
VSRTPVRSSLLGARTVTDRSVDALRAAFHGDVLAPGDEAYDEVRRVWNRMVDRRPAAIARCTGVADVRTARAYANAEGLDVTVRCGGHSIVGHGVADDALLLDLAPMRGVRVDPDRRQVWVQGGARLRDLDRETHPFGLGVPVGVVGDTGVGGLSLGGGYGFATRRYGLTCDNLLAAELVTAGGDLVVVDEEREPELLWGLRGGGGNFGVVTGLTFRLHPLGPIAYGDHLFPVDEGVAPLRAMLELLRDGPDEVTASAVVSSAPAADWVPPEWQGRPALMVSWVLHGPLDEGRRLCAPLAAAGRPVASAEAETTYAELQAFSDVVPGEVGRRYWKGALVTDLPDQALEMILRRGAAPGDPEPRCAVELFGLGGAFGRVGDQDTAFGHRGSICDVLVISGWTDPADDEDRLAEARGFAAQVAQYADGAYVNSLEDESADAVRSAYGATTFDRLTALKDRYDPANVFHHNQNIRPSGRD